MTNLSEESLARPLVILESPFAARSAGRLSQDDNREYVKLCLRDSWNRGELPFASHAFFPLFLDESDPNKRRLGIEAGYRFWLWATKVVFYLDHGWSPGMLEAQKRAYNIAMPYELRKLKEPHL